MPFLDLTKHPPEVVWIPWGFLLGQDLLHSLWQNNRPEFMRRFLGGSADNLRAFWLKHKEGDPRLQNHPMKRKDNWMDITIPGRIHGDVAPYGKGRLAGLNAISWSSKLASGECLDMLNLWIGVPKKFLCVRSEHSVDTMRCFWQVLLWDALSMLQGRRLPHNWNGTPWGPEHRRASMVGELCGGYCVGMMQLGLDGEYAANHLRLKHWRNRYPCNFCPCDQGKYRHMPWEDFREGAPWKSRLRTLEQWLDNLPDHPLWQYYWILGISVFCYCNDMMHTLHKGAQGRTHTVADNAQTWPLTRPTPAKAYAMRRQAPHAGSSACAAPCRCDRLLRSKCNMDPCP